MPITLEKPKIQIAPIVASQKSDPLNGLRRWNIEEYHRLKETGFFGEERTELLDGLIWHPEQAYPRRWTREEYYQLGDMGFFDEERVELLDGRIWRLPPQKTPHFTAICMTTDALQVLFGEGFKIRAQGPFTLPDGTEPEPDVLVVPGTTKDYADRHPGLTDIFLLVEISDSTLSKDRGPKLVDYARAGILDYWIVNLVHRQVEVYRQPSLEGIYGEFRFYLLGESIEPLNAPGKSVAVAELLPPVKHEL